MKNLLGHILLLLMAFTVIWSIPPSPAIGEEIPVVEESQIVQMDVDEAALFDLINAARRDPLGMADTLGLDREEILRNLPELADILANGLPDLAFSEGLYRAAGGHGRDMLANNYYAYVSADGRTPEQRMAEAGYVAAASGEALGLMFFNNFINPDQAVLQIFENMFKDELSPDWEGPRNILNPDFEELGTAIGAGFYQLNGISGNVYLAVCDFGKSINIYEMELLALVNQLRARPGAVTQFFDIDVALVLDVFPEYTDFFENGLPPLAFDSRLYRAAEVQVLDMLENQYWGHVSPEGVTPVMRIRNQGYVPVWAAESKARLSTCDAEIPPANTVTAMFRNMFVNAFRFQGFRDANILSERAMDAGFRTVATESQALSGICGDHVHITVGDFGAGRTAYPILCGTVYKDVNANGLYDAGEGLAGVDVVVKAAGPEGALKTITTSSAGGYVAHLTPGLYRISTLVGDAEQIEWIAMETNRVWQSFQFTE